MFFNLTPRERVEKRYLRWNENFTYMNSKVLIWKRSDLRKCRFFRYRLDILLLGWYRCAFNKPLDFKKEVRKLNRVIMDVNAMGFKEYFKLKKWGKIFF